MFEILFLCGLVAVMLGAIWEYVTALAAFPTLLAGFAIIPLLAWADYLRLLQWLELGGLERRRAPVPPERFYWLLGKNRLRHVLAWTGPLSLAAWAAAIWYPADWALSGSALVGWLAGAFAILATSRFCAAATIYVRASQWFDKMAPWAVGFCRRSLYKLSDNPDFLDPGNPAGREKEKSIY